MDNDKTTNTSSAVVIVVVSNQPPQVTLTQPAGGTALYTPAHVRLVADVFDQDGVVTNVAFFANDTLLGNVATAPFEWVWTDVPAGSYALKARADDDRGGSATSTVTPLSVSPSLPIQLGTAGLTEQGLFTLGGTAQNGGRVVLEASSNLTEWLPLGTNSVVDGTFSFIDLLTPQFTRRFYRASYVPW